MKTDPTPQDVPTFVRMLRERGDLAEIEAPVDADLELAEIHRRVIAAGGPALLFKNVKGSSLPVVSNLFGTRERALLGFGTWPQELVGRIAALPHTMMPPSPGKLWAHRGLFGRLAKVGISRKKRGPVTEVVERDPNLEAIPATRSWPEDGGAFITQPLVYTEHPETGEHNLGMYRMQRHDASTFGMHWQIGKGGGFHHHRAEELNRPLPVNVFVGGPPAALMSAIAPLPEGVPELLLGSLLRGEKIRLADNPVGPLPVLADAEIAFVGEVPPHVRRPEGPFGDHYGYYSWEHDFPVFNVKGIVRRKDAMLPVTVVGKPRQEDFFLGDLLQEILSPLFPVVMPSVLDLWSYGETGYHSLSAAVVRERYRREAMVSAFRILGEGQLSLTKFLLLTDRPVKLQDFKTTLVHLLARCDFRTDLYVFGNLSMDTLDYAGPKLNEGSKGVLLGLGDPIRDLPDRFEGETPPEVRDVRVYCPGCLVIEGPPHGDDPEAAARIVKHQAFEKWPMLVLTDDAARAAKSDINFLWSTFTRFDPAADLHAKETRLFHSHAGFEPPILIDARMKPSYPDELFCDPATSDLVTKRWSEYFPKGMDMGDSDRAHLD